MLEAGRLDELWTPRLRDAGARLFAALEPELERIIREVYAFLLKIPRERVTKDQIERGFVKFRNVLAGQFTAEYLDTQRKTARLLIEKNVDFVTYLLCYSIYHREGALCVASHCAETGQVDPDMSGALHLGLQCDSCVTIDAYFDELARRNAEQAAALNASNYERIMGISDSIGRFSKKTTMLAINATIEAARAGDAGKGFAVVASEIKSVAASIQKATGEIELVAQANRDAKPSGAATG